MKNKRLEKIINFIDKKESVIADIACDHAFLSIEIAKLPFIKKVISSDINEMPLLSGINNIKESGLEDKIETVLSDGIEHLDEEVDCAIIAGVGANLIIDIITDENAKNIKSFILQPNNNVYKIREFASDNGYKIINECVVQDKNIFYEIIKIEKGTQKLSYSQILLGPLNMYNKSDEFIEMTKNRLAYLMMIPGFQDINWINKQVLALKEFLCI